MSFYLLPDFSFLIKTRKGLPRAQGGPMMCQTFDAKQPILLSHELGICVSALRCRPAFELSKTIGLMCQSEVNSGWLIAIASI